MGSKWWVGGVRSEFCNFHVLGVFWPWGVGLLDGNRRGLHCWDQFCVEMPNIASNVVVCEIIVHCLTIGVL